MSRITGALFGLCVFTLGCEQSTRVFSIPTSPSGGTSAPAPTPTPQPLPLPAVEFTTITVGQTVTSVVPTPAPPCFGYPQWPCQHFRFTATSDGNVTVELRYTRDTQPPGHDGLQGVDISVVDEAGRGEWADFWGPDLTRARLEVKEGVMYRITLWYTYQDLKYELTTTLN